MSAWTERKLRRLLERVAAGEVDPGEAAGRLAALGTADLGHSRIDHHRPVRRGMPEVVYGEGKTRDQVVEIVDHLVERAAAPVLVTRLDPGTGEALADRHPRGRWDPVSRTFLWRRGRPRLRPGLLVVSAGTSDLPVAREVEVSAEALGLAADTLPDVGIAGLHRLLGELPRLRRARVIVAVAGMEGALPSVVAGLVAVPVIGVPTSVGYGASFGGLAALLGMLNSCAGGLTVVNIDNGYGAACAARAILDLRRS